MGMAQCSRETKKGKQCPSSDKTKAQNPHGSKAFKRSAYILRPRNNKSGCEFLENGYASSFPVWLQWKVKPRRMRKLADLHSVSLASPIPAEGTREESDEPSQTSNLHVWQQKPQKARTCRVAKARKTAEGPANAFLKACEKPRKVVESVIMGLIKNDSKGIAAADATGLIEKGNKGMVIKQMAATHTTDPVEMPSCSPYGRMNGLQDWGIGKASCVSKEAEQTEDCGFALRTQGNGETVSKKIHPTCDDKDASGTYKESEENKGAHTGLGTRRKQMQPEDCEPVLKKGPIACNNKNAMDTSGARQETDETGVVMVNREARMLQDGEPMLKVTHVIGDYKNASSPFKEGGEDIERTGGVLRNPWKSIRWEGESGSKKECVPRKHMMASEFESEICEGMTTVLATNMQVLELQQVESQETENEYLNTCLCLEKTDLCVVSVEEGLTFDPSLIVEMRAGSRSMGTALDVTPPPSKDSCVTTIESNQFSEVLLQDSPPLDGMVMEQSMDMQDLTTKHGDPCGPAEGTTLLQTGCKGRRHSLQAETCSDQSSHQVDEDGTPGPSERDRSCSTAGDSCSLCHARALPVPAVVDMDGVNMQSRQESEGTVSASCLVRKRKRVESCVQQPQQQRKLLCLANDGDGSSGVPGDKKSATMATLAKTFRTNGRDTGTNQSFWSISDRQATHGDDPSAAQDAATCSSRTREAPAAVDNLGLDDYDMGKPTTESAASASNNTGESKTGVPEQAESKTIPPKEKRNEKNREKDVTWSIATGAIDRAVQVPGGKRSTSCEARREHEFHWSGKEKEKQTSGVEKAALDKDKQTCSIGIDTFQDDDRRRGESGSTSGMHGSQLLTSRVQWNERRSSVHRQTSAREDFGPGANTRGEQSAGRLLFHIAQSSSREDCRIGEWSMEEPPAAEICPSPEEQSSSVSICGVTQSGDVPQERASGLESGEIDAHEHTAPQHLDYLQPSTSSAVDGGSLTRDSNGANVLDEDEQRSCNGNISPMGERDLMRDRNTTVDVSLAVALMHHDKQTFDCRETSGTPPGMEKTGKTEIPQRRSTRVRKSTDTTKCDGIWYAGEMMLKAFERRRTVKRKTGGAATSPCARQDGSRGGNKQQGTGPNHSLAGAGVLGDCEVAPTSCQTSLDCRQCVSFSNECQHGNCNGQMATSSSVGMEWNHEQDRQMADGCIQDSQLERGNNNTRTIEAKVKKMTHPPQLHPLVGTCRQFGQVLECLACCEPLCHSMNMCTASTQLKRGGKAVGEQGREQFKRQRKSTTDGNVCGKSVHRDSQLCPWCSHVYTCSPHEYQGHLKLCCHEQSETATEPIERSGKSEARNRRRVQKQTPRRLATEGSCANSLTQKRGFKLQVLEDPLIADHATSNSLRCRSHLSVQEANNESEQPRHWLSGLQRMSALVSVVEGITLQEEAAAARSMQSFPSQT